MRRKIEDTLCLFGDDIGADTAKRMKYRRLREENGDYAI
jgi:hypothetical protein